MRINRLIREAKHPIFTTYAVIGAFGIGLVLGFGLG